MAEPTHTVYTQTGDDMSSDWGAGPRWLADAYSSQEAEEIMSAHRKSNPLDAIHCEDETGVHYTLDITGKLEIDRYAQKPETSLGR